MYALAGASATATAAACAKRLLEPMTKVSKVYFGFNRAGSARPDGRSPGIGGGHCMPGTVSSTPGSGPSGASPGSPLTRVPSAAGAGTGAGSTVTATRISRPSNADRARVTTGRSRVSSTSLVKSFGAASNAVSSSSPSGRVVRSQARCCGVTALSASPSMACVQRPSRSTVSSGTRSLLPVDAVVSVSVRARCDTVSTGCGICLRTVRVR